MNAIKPTALYEYAGPSCNLGVHGYVNTGDTIRLSLADELSVAGDPDFKRLEPVEGGGATLRATESYDLRSIPWNSMDLQRVLSNKNKTELSRIYEALVEVGALLPDDEVIHYREEDFVAVILKATIYNGWNLMDTSQILGAPGADEVDRETVDPNRLEENLLAAGDAENKSTEENPDENQEETTGEDTDENADEDEPADGNAGAGSDDGAAPEKPARKPARRRSN